MIKVAWRFRSDQVLLWGFARGSLFLCVDNRFKYDGGSPRLQSCSETLFDVDIP